MQGRDWHDDARCRTVGPEIFFPERGEGDILREAKAVCADCKVWRMCAREGLDMGERFGIRAGCLMSSNGDRRKLINALKN